MSDIQTLDHTRLQRIAYNAMLARGLEPDFLPLALAELENMHASQPIVGPQVHDLRALSWISIDNDDSRDLDQLTVAQLNVQSNLQAHEHSNPDGVVNILVAIADVEALVKKGSALDEHARHNTTSVYTVAQIFPMLPEKLSTDLSSLNFNEDRHAIVIDMAFSNDGELESSDIYLALVRNKAKLSYNSLAPWLEGKAPAPTGLQNHPELENNLRLQDAVAQKLKTRRHTNGALDLQTIEDFMIAANSVSARYLSSHGFLSIRRVVRDPKHWDRLVELAAEHGFALPSTPDPKALERFLETAKTNDQLRFPDISLSVIKLLGSGEYVFQLPGSQSTGHFGLALKDYGHATAPWEKTLPRKLSGTSQSLQPPSCSLAEQAKFLTHL